MCTQLYGGKVIEILQVMGITVDGGRERRIEDRAKGRIRRKVRRKREEGGEGEEDEGKWRREGKGDNVEEGARGREG